MKLRDNNGVIRPPICAWEYFTVLYCKRKGRTCMQSDDATNAWKSLSTAEQQVFTNKFEKWQAANIKKMTSILQQVEPFLNKNANVKGNVDSHNTMNATKDESIIDQSEPINTYGNMSNTNLEAYKTDLNVEFYMDDYDEDQSESTMHLVYDDASNANSEVSRPFYTASVIDEDIDEPSAQEKPNEIQTTNSALTEPMPPPSIRARYMFESLKRSGTKPELANVEWRDLKTKEKRMYSRAIMSMNKQYLLKYEKYLESLPSPELFKLYIKFKKEND